MKEREIPIRLIFCSDPLSPRASDAAFAAEVAAATALGIPHSLVHFDALVNEHDARKAVRRVEASQTEEIGVYRGWMLKPEQYRQLYDGLAEQGIRLINTPAAYRHCHYLPESYSVLQGQTPATVWLPVYGEVSMEAVHRALQPFGSKPVIIKDYVKSQKHLWTEACFIPSAANKNAVERVVRRFLQLQGDDLNEGLVFREFIEFEPLGQHTRSGMPLTKEFRIFFLDGESMLTACYWEQGDYGAEVPDLAPFTKIAENVQSRFFTMDVARLMDGSYTIVELGDGQVAGLPERADTMQFYAGMKNQLVPEQS